MARTWWVLSGTKSPCRPAVTTRPRRPPASTPARTRRGPGPSRRPAGRRGRRPAGAPPRPRPARSAAGRRRRGRGRTGRQLIGRRLPRVVADPARHLGTQHGRAGRVLGRVAVVAGLGQPGDGIGGIREVVRVERRPLRPVEHELDEHDGPVAQLDRRTTSGTRRGRRPGWSTRGRWPRSSCRRRGRRRRGRRGRGRPW